MCLGLLTRLLLGWHTMSIPSCAANSRKDGDRFLSHWSRAITNRGEGSYRKCPPKPSIASLLRTSSYRSPRFNVTLGVTFQESSMNADQMLQMFVGTGSGML